MNSDFEIDFDTILEEIIADTLTKYPGADVSFGSPTFMLAARLAAVCWGLHKKQSNIVNQIFVDTAITQLVDRHAYCAGLTRAAGENDASLAARVWAEKNKPAAGGNKDDFEAWASEVAGVSDAHCVPTPLGAGTVAVVVLAAAGDAAPVPDQDLLDAVTLNIEAKRCVTSGDFSVLPVQVVKPDISMTVTGSINTAALSASILAYCDGLHCKDTLILSQLVNLAVALGATDAVVTAPGANVVTTDYQVIRAGAIAINI